MMEQKKSKAFFIRLEVEEDLEFLRQLLDQAVARMKAPGEVDQRLVDNAPSIYRLHDVVHNAVKEKDFEKLEVPIEEFPEATIPKKKPKRTAKEIEEATKGIPACRDHPTNQFKRRPGTDCEGCWAAYKQLHPLEYDQARKAYERKKNR